MTITKLKLLLALPIIAIALGFLALPQVAKAASTYTVNSIGDDPDANPGDLICETATLGECTLRAAIQEVNAGAGGDTINFGIAGTGIHTLTPASGYDTITQSVTIDGYSQPGAVANTAPSPQPFNGTLTIELDGTSAGSGAIGLRVGANNVIIKGLVINRFTENGIDMLNRNNIMVQGNYIGTDPTGLIDRGNGIAGARFIGGTGNIVGGSLPAERNIISGNTGAGFDYGFAANNVFIKGNYFGLAANGTAVLQNTGTGTGDSNVWVAEGESCIVGGPSPSDSNVFSGSPGIGLGLYMSSNCIVQGNFIGTDYQGNVLNGFGNTIGGIILMGETQNNLIGGINNGEGNIIAGNGAGVLVSDLVGTLLALNNSILGNSIHNNMGGVITTLGIDLLGNSNDFATFSDTGVTLNDAGDPDVTSNVLMNFPVISSVTSTNGQATITYNLDINDAEPGATGYRVEFFANDSADPSGHGQGQTYIGSDTVAGDVTGQQVTITLPNGVDGSKYITATTTMTDESSDGFGHTSEFAADVQATLLPPTPTPGPTPTPSPSPSGNSVESSSLAGTGDAQHTSQRLFIALALITAGVLGLGGLTTQRIYTKRRKNRV